MARRWLQLSNYNALMVFIAMGVFAGLFTWNSFNLVHLAMENIRYIGQFGRMAIVEGGFSQLFEIVAYGYLSLAFYVAFKACEVELVHRWRNWQGPPPSAPP